MQMSITAPYTFCTGTVCRAGLSETCHNWQESGIPALQFICVIRNVKVSTSIISNLTSLEKASRSPVFAWRTRCSRISWPSFTIAAISTIMTTGGTERLMPSLHDRREVRRSSGSECRVFRPPLADSEPDLQNLSANCSIYVLYRHTERKVASFLIISTGGGSTSTDRGTCVCHPQRTLCTPSSSFQCPSRHRRCGEGKSACRP